MADGATPREKKAHQWDRDVDNFYCEPSWCAERLFSVERFPGRIVDPCAGRGNIITGAARAGGWKVRGFDLRDRGVDGVQGGVDFFDPNQLPGRYPVECIISNPPYGNRPKINTPAERKRWEEEFLRLALDRARIKVALFLDSAWTNGAARGRWLEGLPLYRVYKLAPRPSCPPGPYLAAGGKAGNGTKDYAWHVFLIGFDGHPTLHFLRRDKSKSGKTASECVTATTSESSEWPTMDPM